MKDSNGMIYFLCGLGIGAAAATLFAERSGAETRAKIAATVGDGVEKLKSTTQDVSKTVGDTIQMGKDAITRNAQNLSAAVEAGKQAYRESVATTPFSN